MGRKHPQHNLPPVSDFEVAQHRYLWNAPTGADTLSVADSMKSLKVRDAAPYQKGEVVWVVYGDGFIRAYIEAVWVRRKDGDLVEYYRVRHENKNGQWSRVVKDAFPGYIQRGYYRAGLAPDIPDGVL